METQVANSLGVRISAIRNALSLTQELFGKPIGTDRTTILKWEADEVVPRKSKIKAMLQHYNINPTFWEKGTGDIFLKPEEIKAMAAESQAVPVEFFIKEIEEKNETIRTLERTVNYFLSQLGIPLPGKPKVPVPASSSMKVVYSRQGTNTGTGLRIAS